MMARRLVVRHRKAFRFCFGLPYCSLPGFQILDESLAAEPSLVRGHCRMFSTFQRNNIHHSAWHAQVTTVETLNNGLIELSSPADNKNCRNIDVEAIRERRIRTALVLFKTLAKEAKISLAQAHQSRRFSSNDSSSKPPPATAGADASDERSGPSRTEPDFAKYLKGGQEIDRVDGTEESSTTEFNLPDADSLEQSKEDSQRNQNIRRRQKTNLDQARAKTAANVRRALGGNLVICAAKFGAWISSGSSSMLSEFIHSVVDCGNQSLLLVGLRDSTHVADRSHPYGYGKSVYFWALVSALGTFFLGAGVSMTHSIGELMEPSLHEITWQVWGVLGLSLAVDGYVFGKTITEIAETKPPHETLYTHLTKIRDPATLAILLEDGAACIGVLMALAGISVSHATDMPIFDAMAGVGISALLASMGLILVRVNHRFLLGQAVDKEITEGIEKIIRSQRSIDSVHSVQSQWTSSETFSFKAEVDFDGTYLAAKLLPRYQREFLEVKDSLDQELRVLLSWYAEDVIRTVEREVRHIEAEIRKDYPGAEFIELEPSSKQSFSYAIDDGMEAQLRRIELEALNRYLKSLYDQSSKPPSDDKDKDASDSTKSGGGDNK